MIAGASVSVGLACAATLAYAAWRPMWAWRLRKLPGPRRLPLMGNLLSIMAHGDLLLWIQDLSKRYGGVFKVWTGCRPVIMVTDVHLSRKLLMSCTSRPSLEQYTCLVGTDHELVHKGLLSLSPDKDGAKFRFLRKAFEQTVMSPSALAAHAVMLEECASRLVTYLSRYAASGEPVDVRIPLSDMTMTAIGFAAFGLDLDCQGMPTSASDAPTAGKAAGGQGTWQDTPPGNAEFSHGLVEACRLLIKNGEQGSYWMIPSVFVPALYDVIRHVANTFPDTKLRQELQARRAVFKALRAMVAEWKRHKGSVDTADSTGASMPAISDRGFLATLLGSMGSEDGIQDLDVMAQCFTMLLAGYETTASALSATLHLLAQHPEAQAQVQDELDAVLHGKLATAEDLERLPYLCAVLDEALRMYPPGNVALRELTPLDKDLDLGDGRVIPGGAFIWVDIYTFHNDPAIWPRATEFLPERFLQPGNETLAPSNPHAYLPFGIGSRMCPGYKFALMEARLALARILQAYTFKPAPNCPPPKWMVGIVYSADHVWLNVSPRQQANGKQER